VEVSRYSSFLAPILILPCHFSKNHRSKVLFVWLHVRQANRESRGIALPILKLGIRVGGCLRQYLSHFTPQGERDLVRIVQMGIRVDLDRCGKSCAHGVRPLAIKPAASSYTEYNILADTQNFK